jgi:hypothetical protein
MKSSTRRARRRGASLIEIVITIFLMAMAVMTFGGFYPTAARSSQMSGNHAQAISIVQHKVDQMRAVGYGRLTYTELRNAGVIDSTSTTSPFRFEAVDQVSTQLPAPVGTITLASAGTDLMQVTIKIQWTGFPAKTNSGSYEVRTFIANE